MRAGEALEYAQARLIALVEAHQAEHDGAGGSLARKAGLLDGAAKWAQVVNALKGTDGS